MVLKLFVENLCMKILQRFHGGGEVKLVKNYNTLILGQFWVIVASL